MNILEPFFYRTLFSKKIASAPPINMSTEMHQKFCMYITRAKGRGVTFPYVFVYMCVN